MGRPVFSFDTEDVTPPFFSVSTSSLNRNYSRSFGEADLADRGSFSRKPSPLLRLASTRSRIKAGLRRTSSVRSSRFVSSHIKDPIFATHPPNLSDLFRDWPRRRALSARAVCRVTAKNVPRRRSKTGRSVNIIPRSTCFPFAIEKLPFQNPPLHR